MPKHEKFKSLKPYLEEGDLFLQISRNSSDHSKFPKKFKWYLCEFTNTGHYPNVDYRQSTYYHNSVRECRRDAKRVLGVDYPYFLDWKD